MGVIVLVFLLLQQQASSKSVISSSRKEAFITNSVYQADVGYALSRFSKNWLSYRGGSSDFEEEEDIYDESDEGDLTDEEEDDEMDGMTESATSVAIDMAKRTAKMIGKISVLTFKRFQFALQVTLESEEEADDGDGAGEEETSLASKVLTKVGIFLRSLLQGPDSVAVAESSSSSIQTDTKKENKQSSKSRATASFATYLKSSHGVKVPDHMLDETFDGSLSDALAQCRSQAKFLVAFLPASSLSSKKKQSSDFKAAQSLYSDEVIDIMSEYKGGSYSIWGCVGGGRDASTAAKRIRASVRKSIPILAVIYPARVIDSSGRQKIVPKLLAQHHCNPPPTSEAMAAWLKALRKRHSKQIKAMKHEIKERELFAERKEGYKSSSKSDKEREQKEAMIEAERKAKEEAERKRLEELEERRQVFSESLPDEPAQGSANVITIALRLADGRSGKRRFNYSTSMEYVFNWVDAEYAIEREKVILTTMNGSKVFTFEDFGNKNLEETGLGKMTGLRVTEMEEEVEEECDMMEEQ